MSETPASCGAMLSETPAGLAQKLMMIPVQLPGNGTVTVRWPLGVTCSDESMAAERSMSTIPASGAVVCRCKEVGIGRRARSLGNELDVFRQVEARARRQMQRVRDDFSS